eukprot:TRINITY_DN9389_c0_g1_i7.p1 TRINITY_DN9389_c0_g1~~TRINITY_DN9389_c0_g1_i7.p1  ORF type:complete len:864 (-),score=268.01 TRINITY_DN9389_c0_g1_i7:774-3365(-)
MDNEEFKDGRYVRSYLADSTNPNGMSNSKSKKSISTMFDEALKSVNDISDLIPPSAETPAAPSFSFPFAPYNPGAVGVPMHNPNDMMHFMPPFPQYQRMQNQMGAPANQIPMNNFTLGPIYQPNIKPSPDQKAEPVNNSNKPKQPFNAEPTYKKQPNHKAQDVGLHAEQRVRGSVQRRAEDELPIKCAGKTFEELLEEKLMTSPSKAPAPNKPRNTSRTVEKKAFLKRKSANVRAAPAKKKYAYYADKFAKNDSVEETKKSTPKKLPKFRKEKGKANRKDETPLGQPIRKNESRLAIADSALGPSSRLQKVKDQLLIHNEESSLPQHQPSIENSPNDNIKNSPISDINGLDEQNNNSITDDAKDGYEEEYAARDDLANEEHKEDEPETELNLDNEFEGSGGESPKFKEELKDPRDIMCHESLQNDNQQEVNPEVENKLKVRFRCNGKELEEEIEGIKKDQIKVKKQKENYERLLNKLKEERAEFEQYKEKELASINELKGREMRKISQEKKSLERKNKAAQNVPAKKDKEEIEALKRANSKLREDLLVKESRFKLLLDKTKKQGEEAMQINKQLEAAIKEFKEQLAILKAENKKLKAKNEASTAKSPSHQYIHSPKDNKHEINHSDEYQAKQSSRKSSCDDQKPISKEEYDSYEYEEDKEATDGVFVNNDTENYDLEYPQEYHSKNVKLISQRVYNDGKVVKKYENGKTEVAFPNGVRKESFPDGYTVIYFNNGDIKQVCADGKVAYYFAEARTTQTTFTDGLQVFKFPSGQLEKHYPDGTKEINFPNGTLKCIFADGEEESVFTDGTVQRVKKNGEREIEYPNGEREIELPDGTLVKVFPDGRVRKTYPDGTYENTFIDHNK